MYIIQNNINLKIYVGKSKERKVSRFDEHLKLAHRGKSSKDYSLVHAGITKHGAENFTFSTLEFFDLEQDALEAEKFWIDFFRTDVNKFGSEYGYNLTAGGDGLTKPHSAKTKQKIKDTILKKLEDPNAKEELVSRLREGKIKNPPQPIFNIGCKISWPTDIDLVSMVKNSSCKEVARTLGVSNIAVRERLKRRGLYPFNKI